MTLELENIALLMGQSNTHPIKWVKNSRYSAYAMLDDGSAVYCFWAFASSLAGGSACGYTPTFNVSMSCSP